MKKTSLLILFALIILSSFFCFSCKKSEIKEDNVLSPDKEYTVGIKGPGIESKGKIVLGSDGTLTLRYADANSPLFGMVSVTDGEKNTVWYGDILWESDETSLFVTKLFSHLAVLQTDALETSEESLRGYLCRKKVFREGDVIGFVWSDTESGEVIRICLESDSFYSELNFSPTTDNQIKKIT